MYTLRLSILLIPLVFFVLIKFISFLPFLQELLSFLGATFLVLYSTWKISFWLGEMLLGMLDVNGKAVLVTGCDSGIGHETALELNQCGFRVIAACLNPDGEAAQELKNRCHCPDRLHILGLNVTSTDDVLRSFRQSIEAILSENYSSLWAIVNNAGVLTMGLADWGDNQSVVDNVIRVNLIGTMRVTREFLPLIRRSRGRIINMSSIMGKIPIPFAPTYSTTKSALLFYSNVLRMTVCPWGVKIISILPYKFRSPISTGEFATRSLESNWNNTSDEVKEVYGEGHYLTLRRLMSTFSQGAGDPSEVARAVMYGLLSQEPPNEIVCAPWYFKFILFLYSICPQELIDLAVEVLDSRMFHT